MKKTLAFLLSVVMVLQLSPFTALALPAGGITETVDTLSEGADTQAQGTEIMTGVSAETHVPAELAGTTASDHNHTGWTEWTSATSLPSSAGKYYLTKDVSYQITSPKSAITSDVTLCLNGHTIKVNSKGLGDTSGYGEVYRSNAAAAITLCDCQHSGVIEGTGKTAGMVYTGSSSTAKVTICDITFKNTSGPGGNAVQMNSSSGSSSLEMTNVTFENCSSKAYSPVYLNSKTGNAVIKNCNFKSCFNTASSGTTSACIYVCKQLSASNTIEGCSFIGNAGKNTNGGGAIYVLGNLDIKDSRFIGNTNAATGGAIYAGSTAVMNISGSTFQGNASEGNGGVLHVTSSSATAFATVALNGCSFIENVGKVSAIYVGTYAVLTVKDTKITDNIATDTGAYTGALYVIGNKVTVEGATVIKGNFNSAASPAPADFILQNDTTVFTLRNATADTYLNIKTQKKENKPKGAALGTIESGALLGTYNWMTEPEDGVVIGESGGTIKLMDTATAISLPGTMKVQQNYSGNIEAVGIAPADSYAAPITWTSSDESVATVASSGPSTAIVSGVALGEVTITAALASDPSVTASCLVTVTDKHEHEDGVEYLPWTETNSLPKEGYYYLTSDVTISGNQNNVTGDVHLCMDGHTIKTKYAGSGLSYGELFRIQGTGHKVYVTSCEEGAAIQAIGENKGAFFMNATASGGFYIENVKFTGFNNAGGAITFNGTGESVIKNCIFENNQSSASAAVYGNGTGVKVTLDGCTFTGNKGTSGAAMFVKGDWTLKDCVISDNITTSNGAVYLSAGSVTITGNTRIVGNKYSNGGVTDVVCSTGSIILSELGDDAAIGISVLDTTAAGTVIAKAGSASEDVSGKIVIEQRGDSADRNLSSFIAAQEGTDIKLAPLGVHSHASGSVGEGLSWKGWANAAALPTAAGNYLLLTDVAINTSVSNSVSGDMNFCLNGHTIEVENPKAAQETGYGEVFRINGGQKVTVCNCKAEGGIEGTGDTAAALYTSKSATGRFIIDGISFKNISGKGGCAVSLNSETGSATAQITNCRFEDCTAKAYGIIYGNSPAAGSIVIRNCTFSGVKGESTRGACIHFTAKVKSATVDGCIFTNCTGLRGTALYSAATGTTSDPAQLTVTDCKFTGNTTAVQSGASVSDPNGGIIFLSNESGAANNIISSCSFTGNESLGASNASAAGVYVVQRTADGGTLIDRCTFTGNKSAGSGGMVVNLSGGKSNVCLKDTTITDSSSGSSSGNYVGAVYVTNAGDRLTLAGRTVIDGNYSNNGKLERNIYLQGESTIYVDGLADGSNVSVYARTGDYTDANKLISVPDGQSIPAVWGNWIMFDSYGTYVLFDSTASAGSEFYFDMTHSHCLCGDAHGAGCGHEAVNWILWMKTDELPAISGYYALGGDVVVSATTVISTAQDIHICFNGHTISAEEGTVTRGYELSGGAKLSFSDCRASVHNGVYSAGGFNGMTNGIVFQTNLADSELTVYDGCFTNNTREDVGAVFYVGRTAKASIYMADISYNTAKTGPVFVQAAAELNIYDGYFHHNDAGVGWGGFMTVQGATVNITGGEFYNNTVTENLDNRRGGAINFIEGTNGTEKTRNTVVISNAKFYNNSATKEGGAISFGASDVVLNNVSFTGNYSDTAGGALLMTMSTKVEMNDCYFADNEGRIQAGAIQLYQFCELDLNSGLIENNVSHSGGGIYASKNSVLRIKGGTINGNKATTGSGGGIFARESDFSMSSGTISNNYAKSYGGGLDVFATKTCEITGGEIRNNEAGSAGGGICFNGSYIKDEEGNVISRYITPASVSGVSISGNKAKNAGGFVEQTGADVTMSNVKIQKNIATYTGGGGYIGRYCSLKFKSGTISGNDARNGGGGGLYFAKSTDNAISGGTIRDNKCKGSGGGLYFVQSRAVLSGGTVSGNRSYNEKECYGGGIMIGGGGKTATGDRGLVELCGITVKNNYALTCGGVCISAVGRGIIGKGTTIKNNTANIAAGVLCQSEGSDLKIRGGVISGNETKKSMGAGVFISTKTTFTMTGGTITKNKSITSAGGLTLLRCKANISGGTISDNIAKTYGGGFYAQGSEANISNLTIKNNVSETQAGGGICLTSVNVTQKVEGTDKTYIDKLVNTITFKNCKICGNEANNGGAMVVQGAPGHKVTISGGEWYENTARTGNGGAIYNNLGEVLIKDSSFHDNTASNLGGVLYGAYHNKWENNMVTVEGGEFYNNSASSGGAFALQGRDIINNAFIHDNTALSNAEGKGGVGGGVYVNARSNAVMNNCVVSDNKAVSDGGGVFVQLGGKLDADGLTVTGNTSDGRGGGMCVLYETTLTNTVITGNKAPECAGMYIEGGYYDGESYYMGPYKIGGKMVIKDNDGKYSGLYIEKGGLITVVNGIFDKETDMHINLAEGVLTDTLIGQYNYEGGNLAYDVSCGDKSVTDPEEHAAPAPALTPETAEAESTEAETGTETEAETEESGSKGIMITAIVVSAAAVICGGIAIVSNARKKKNKDAQ